MRYAFLVACWLLVVPLSVNAQDMPGMGEAAHCGVIYPARSANAYVPLPSGDVFCPLIADPKEPRSFASYLHGTTMPFDTEIGSVGISEHFGLVRWGLVQISLSAAVFAQFDLLSDSFDLINADYLVGIPITARFQAFSVRFRAYHQSSHLGDEFLLRQGPLPPRENLSFESFELILSQAWGPARVYGGGEVLVNRNPDDLDPLIAHGGAELRQQRPLLRIGRLGSLRVLAAADFKATEEQDWALATSVRAGIEVGRPQAGAAPSRTWRLLVEYYTGPTPYGQFFRDEIEYIGFGMHLAL